MHSLAELNERLTRPTPAEVDSLDGIGGDIIVLGASGKMGPSLVGRICRASKSRKVYAAARFTDPGALEEVRSYGAETISCDLHNPTEVEKLPQAANVFYLVGRKFGSTGRPDLTWAANTIVPSMAGWHFRKSRIVVFSSGNVYPYVEQDSNGCYESTEPQPVGEYAQSALARERIFEYWSRECGTRCAILRLNYAVDLRYGVLVDIARKVWDGETVSTAVPRVNAIWQGDANRYALLSLGLCESPAHILNMTSLQIVDVKAAANYFGERFGKVVHYASDASGKSLLNDPSECIRRFGPPEIDLETLQEWVAQWIESGGSLLDKPTHFEATDGRF